MQSALECLNEWQVDREDIFDKQTGITQMSVCALANRTIQLADIEGVSLDELLPDASIRELLKRDAKAFDDWFSNPR